jgi:hypothetical protein
MSALQSNRKRECFNLNKPEATRKLTPSQCFSKLYYKSVYKGPVTLRWREEYTAHYDAMKTDETEDDEAEDAKVLDKQIQKSMRKHLKAGLLDVTVSPAEHEGIVDDDPENNPNGAEDEEDEEGDGEDTGDDNDKDKDEDGGGNNGGDDNATYQHFKVPKVPLWFQNAAMKALYDKASQSQQDAVSEYEKKQDEEAKKKTNVGRSEAARQLLTDGPDRVENIHTLIRFVSPVSSRSELTNHSNHVSQPPCVSTRNLSQSTRTDLQRNCLCGECVFGWS